MRARLVLPCLVAILMVGLGARVARCIDHYVTNTSEFSAALAAATPGDTVLLAPGIYDGGHYRHGLTGVTIRGADTNDWAIIRGGGNGLQLSHATDVTLEYLVFEQQTSNGINIDDGGSQATPTSNLMLRNLVVRNMNASGNNDGIKLSGVTGFLIDRVQVLNWGAGGSAIDPVGSHHGLIQNSLFRHSAGAASGVRPKGGSKDIVIRANRFEIGGNQGRAIQAGGSTGAEFFRFIDGDSGYEAAEIVAEGNVVIGGGAAFGYVNIDGGVFHHNYVHRPERWAVRILNENPGSAIVDPQRGEFRDNVVVFDGSQWSTAVNVGGETLPQTYKFVGNSWFNLANPTPAGSTPTLPVAETDGTYGVDPAIDPQEPIVWAFSWGKWIVNASEGLGELDAGDFAGLKLASPATGAKFRPLLAQPLGGTWTFADLSGPTLAVQPFSQLILVDPAACAACLPMPGDFDQNRVVDQADYLLWKQQFGVTGSGLAADGNGDQVVDAADYTLWRNHLSSQISLKSTISVPEPKTFEIFGLLGVTTGLWMSIIPSRTQHKAHA